MLRPRVLVVDPDAASRELIRKVLRRHCDLLLQSGPLRILESLELFEPDLTILELMQIELGGFELLDLIRGLSGTVQPRLMVFSSLHDPETQKTAYRLGAVQFLAKPCRPSQLFKSAVMIARRAAGICAICGEAPGKKLSLEEARLRLAELEQGAALHPIMAAALNEQQAHRSLEHAGQSILASVSRRRPVG